MSEPVNKWNQPEAAPPPMFFGRKERDLVKQVNDELAERVVGQTVAYYPVSLEDSNYHPLYGEAVDKVTLPPIRVFAYVTVENEQTNERYGYEYQTKLTVNFNRKRLTDDQNLFVRVGDFLQYGEEFYEIVRTYNDTRYYFGQVEHKFQISADCIKARKGTFRVRGEMKKQLELGTITTASAALPLPAPPPAVPFAPSNAQYVVLSTDATLTQERVLTAGAGITLTDGGANGAITIAAPTAAQSGIFTQVDSSNAYTTSSATVGASSTPTHTLTVAGSTSGSGAFINVGAATLGSTLSVSGALTLVGTGSVSSINMTGTLSASSTARFGSSVSSSGDVAVTGNVHATIFYGSAAGLTGISSDAVDVTSSTGDINYPIVFTEGFQTDGTLGLGGNTALVYNPNDALLSSSAGAQLVGASIFGGTLAVSGAATLAATASVSSVVATGSISGSSTLEAAGATILGSTLYVSGNTGIGTASPGTLFEVSGGDVQILATSPGAGIANPTDGRLLFDKVFDNSGEHTANKIVLYDDGGVGASWKGGIGVSSLSVDFYSGDNFNFWTDHGSAQQGDNRFTILTNGNVGIGTDAPDYALDVAGTVGIDSYIYHNGDADTYLRFQADEVNLVAGGKSVIRLDESGTNDKIQINNTNADIDLQVMADDGEVILHTDAGTNRVGINTITPGVALEVVGAMSASSTLQAVGAATLGSTLNVSGAITALATGSLSSVNMTGSLSGSHTAVFGSSVSSSGDVAVTGNVHAASYYGDGSNLSGIAGDASGSARHYSATGLETSGYLRVTGSTTLVGTGSVSSIVATGSISGSSTLEAAGATILGSTLYVSGNVGIGTDSPTYALDVAGDAGFNEYIYHNGDTDTYIRFQGDQINIVAGAAQMIYINEGGAGAQADKVTINNDSTDIDFQVKGTDWDNLLRTDAVEGRVGIGLQGGSLPTHTLTVAGAISGSSTLEAIGATILGSTLAVSGAATLAATGSFSSVNMTGSLSGSHTAVFGSSVSSSGDVAVTGNVHAAVYYGDGSNLTGIAGNVSGSARHYSATGLETSGYLRVTGSTTLVGTGSVSSVVATGSISGSSTLQAVGAVTLGDALSVSGSSTFGGGITYPRSAITAATYTVLVTDYYIGVDPTSNAVTLTLPVAATAGTGKTYVIKDESGQAGSNAITIDGDGSETVDGAASFDINSPYGAAHLYTDGSNWFIY